MKHLLSRDGWSGMASIAGTPKAVSWNRGDGLTIHSVTEAEADAILAILSAAEPDARTIERLMAGTTAIQAPLPAQRPGVSAAVAQAPVRTPEVGQPPSEPHRVSEPPAVALSAEAAAPPVTASKASATQTLSEDASAEASPAATPAQPADQAGDEVPEKIVKATQIRHVIAALEEQGITKPEDIIRECERLKATGKVPVLSKVANVPERVTRALDVMGARAGV